jgi:tRNA 2-thiouridine synthesizing protein B
MLHIVNKSPFQTSTLQSCLDHARAGDAILLIEDGVYAAIRGSAVATAVTEAKGKVTFHALGPDIAARGIAPEKLIDGVTSVDYGGFVDLVAEHKTNQAWL